MPDDCLAFFRSEILVCFVSSIDSIGVIPAIYPYLFSFFSLQ
ncbi:ferrochelatase [Pectobacterium actinidiae]|nr:ferrochelatase [Pectobacterium actinidiae]